MKIETLLSRGSVPDKITLISTVSSWSKQPSWRLADYRANVDSPYIENIPYSLFELSSRGDNLKDGRGFSLRLTQPNLSMLLLNARIRNGRIAEPCQYLKLNHTAFWLLPIRLLNNG